MSSSAGQPYRPSNSKKCGNYAGNAKSTWKPYRRNWSSKKARDKPVAVQMPKRASSKSSSEYPSWQLYFPQEKYDIISPTARRIKNFEEHFLTHECIYDFLTIKQQFFFTLSIPILLEDKKFKSEWKNFTEDLTEQPEHILNCAGIAMHKLMLLIKDSSENTRLTSLLTVRARIQGYVPTINLRSLKVNNYGRLVSIKGTIIRAAASKIICTWMAFKCKICGAEQTIKQTEGVVTTPKSCSDGCRARSNFIPFLSSLFTRTVAFQTIRLQESLLDEQFNSGRIPRSIEIEVTEDLVDTVCPGDNVTVTGILTVRPQDDLQHKEQCSTYKLYLRAVAVLNNKTTIFSKKSEFTVKDMEAIKMINREPSTFKLFVQSLCPAIYGHEIVKAGLVLGLFGATSEAGYIGRRSEIHVLVVGDPGIGKSQILQASANVSPRGIFVCGNSSTNAGLTVTVRHEKGCVGGGGSLEAGALVLADQGSCCIDEFDKMSNNHQSLIEVMEQQTVSVAKAGVLCSLPARTSILAAANPCGGHYNRSKTVSENLKLNSALLSRFDLVFILLDRPNKHLDNLLAAHIQALHTGTKIMPNSHSLRNSKPKEGTTLSNEIEFEHKALVQELKLDPGEELDLLPHSLMQKYIAFARKNIHPRLTAEAAQEIKKFYLELRKVRAGMNSIPVTTRLQLEGLIRLTQARARVDLETNATLQHALEVISMVRYSLVDILSTENGTLQIDRNVNGSGMSQATKIRKFLNNLQNRSISLNKTTFSTDELKEVAVYSDLFFDFSHILDSLNIQGFLIKKGKHFYKLLNQ